MEIKAEKKVYEDLYGLYIKNLYIL